jgi:hypothetical protein
LKKEGREMLDGREKREIYGAHVISLLRKGEGKKKKGERKRRKAKGERKRRKAKGERKKEKGERRTK